MATKTKRKYELNWLQIVRRLESARARLILHGGWSPELDEAIDCLRDRLNFPPLNKPEQSAEASQVVATIKMAQEHVSELRDAWQRGSIREIDVSTDATRPNRNAQVEVALRRALEMVSP